MPLCLSSIYSGHVFSRLHPRYFKGAFLLFFLLNFFLQPFLLSRHLKNTRVTGNHDVMLDYMKYRHNHFASWFENGKGGDLKLNADVNGSILDFAIVGFPKCGTTTVQANLVHIAPIPVGDICAPVHQIVWYAYKNWPRDYPGTGEDTKLFRGNKCPSDISNLSQFSKYLPRTKIIIGIRHPVLWFQSFWNMQASNHVEMYQQLSPYNLTQSCEGTWGCRSYCPHGQNFCMHRSRFHLNLAQMGKTPLSDTERTLLAPNDYDGGKNVANHQIRNPIFLYEQTQLSQDYVWDDMAQFLNYPGEIPHNQFRSSRGKQNNTDVNKINICDVEYDNLRKLMMPYAYEMSKWICDYLVPLAEDENRPDVYVSKPDRFSSMVRDYAKDPCGRLVRMENGTYTVMVSKEDKYN